MGLFDGTPLARPILCERCGKDVKECKCPPADVPPGKQHLKIRLEKRKKGKLVTVVTGFDCSSHQLQETLTALKSKCGAGGTIAERTIELQGDHTQRVPELLKERGYRL
jgi:translation initiation factor 1